MAQLKDTLITGSLRVTDTIYTNITLLSILHAPTTSSGGSIGAGTAGNILFSNGTTASYWGATTGITALGTITTGTWNATAIAVNHGGTGIEQYTTGDILYASASTTLSKLAKGEVGQILISASNAPAWNGSILVDTTNNIVKIAPNLNDNTTLQIGTQNMTITNNTNLRHLYGKFTIYTTGGFQYAGIGTATGDTLRYIWFNDDSLTGKPVISTSFKYNPKTKTIRIGGPSSSTVDGDDNSIIELYRGDSSKTNWLIANTAGNFTLKDNHNGSSAQSTYVRTLLSFAYNSALSITSTSNDGTIASTSTLYLKAATSGAASLIFYGWDASLATPAQGEIARFNSSGKFIVGTPSSPNDITELLYVNGNTLFAYNSTSDTSPILKLKDGTGYLRKLIGAYAGSVIMGMLAYNGGGSGNTISKSLWLFREFAPQETAANATTGKYENYLLPSATAGLAANISYDILTTKLFTNTANYDNKYLVLTSSGTNDSVVFSTALLLDDNSVQKMPRLASGTELNTLVPGVYFVPTAAIATGCLHPPLTTMSSGGIIINLGSYSNTNNTYRFLIFRGSASGSLWIRHLNNTTAWDAWRRIATLTADDTQFDINSGYTSLNGYNLRIYNASATTDNYTASILLSTKDTTTGKVESGYVLLYNSHSSSGTGGHLTLSTNGSVEIFCGEGATRVKELRFTSNYEGEAIYLVADTSILLLANANNDTFGSSPVANRKGVLLRSDGSAINPVGVSTTDYLTTESQAYAVNLGTSSYPWGAAYTGGYYLYHTASGETTVTLQGSFKVATSGVAGTQGITAITLGNEKDSATANNSKGRVTLYGAGANYTHIQTAANADSGNRTFNLPAYAGDMYAAHISTSAVGNTKRPAYCTSTGRITVCSYQLWASVGTAAADIVANLLIYSSSATKILASGHYASTSKIAINSATAPDENLYVNGTVKTGKLYVNVTGDTISGTGKDGSIIIGDKDSKNIGIDEDEIHARNNGAASTLYINYEGGSIITGVDNTSYYFQIRSTAVASSTTSGALRVGGGVGIGGRLYVGDSSTFYGSLHIVCSNTDLRTYYRFSSNTEYSAYLTVVRSSPGDGDLYYDTRFRFLLYSYSSTDKSRGLKYEYYELPIVKPDLAEDKTYSIWTTRDLYSAYVTYNTVGLSSGDNRAFWVKVIPKIAELLPYAANNIMGLVAPNSTGPFFGHIYNPRTTNSSGTPLYSTFFWSNLGGYDACIIGTNNYNYYRRNFFTDGAGDIGTTTGWNVTASGAYYVASSASFSGTNHPGSTTGELAPYGYGTLLVFNSHSVNYASDNTGGLLQIYASHLGSNNAASGGLRYRTGWNNSYTIGSNNDNVKWTTILDSNNALKIIDGNNNNSTYCNLCIANSRGNYYGIVLGPNKTYGCLMSNGNNFGLYSEGNRWAFHFSSTDNRASIGNYTTESGYLLTVHGSQHTKGDMIAYASDGSNRSVKALNSNGVIGLYASSNRGIYDWTKTKWLIYFSNSDNIARIPSTLQVIGDKYTGPAGNYGLDMNNSDIINANGIFTKDLAENFGEGYMFYRDATHWDGLVANNGTFYFGSNLATYNASLIGNADVTAGRFYGYNTMAHLSTNALYTSGYIRVVIHDQTSWMLAFTVRIYSGYAWRDYHVSGYNYGSSYWYSPKVECISSDDLSAHDVVFGHGTAASSGYYKLWVAFPCTSSIPGSYYGVDVINVTNGFTLIAHPNITIEYQSSLTGTLQTTVTVRTKCWKRGESITGAVWNDYAEYRATSNVEPGRVVMEKGDDTLIKTEERLSHFAGIVSDTWGFAQGETELAKSPIAVAGRALAYTYQDRNNYQPGDAVCAAPNGTVDIMTREEIINYPDRIVGTVSCIPEYEEWGHGDRDPVKVDNRIWIKVK